MKSSNLSSLVKVNVSVRVSVAETPFRPGGAFGVPVVLVNEGDGRLQWSDRAPLNLSYRWLGEDGVLIESDGRRTVIPNGSIGEGERIDLKLMGFAPEMVGRYTLLVSLVLENVHWACDIGAGGWAQVGVHVPVAQTWPTHLSRSPGERALRGALLAIEIGRSLHGSALAAPRAEASPSRVEEDRKTTGGDPIGGQRPGYRMRDWLRRARQSFGSARS